MNESCEPEVEEKCGCLRNAVPVSVLCAPAVKIHTNIQDKSHVKLHFTERTQYILMNNRKSELIYQRDIFIFSGRQMKVSCVKKI